MPHGNRSVDELLAESSSTGADNALALHHALLEEEGEQVNTLGSILDDPDSDEDGGPGGDDDGGGPSRSETEATSRSEREEDINLTGLDQQFSEEIIEQVQREFFDVQTPEDFLDDFMTSFSGFAVNAAAAGLSDADFEQMIDPRSGFMQQMLTEFIGEQAKRALASGETPFETVGVQGEPEFLGTREGDVSETSFRRVTRTEAEEQLRRDGVEVTEESITQLIEQDAAQQQTSAQSTRTSETDDRQTTTEDTTDVDTGTTQFTQELEVFSRPRIDQVFKFSPTDFFLSKFALPEGLEQDKAGTEKFLGMISTQIRAAAPRVRPGGGGPTSTSISARRA